jgi:hypothetical protein
MRTLISEVSGEVMVLADFNIMGGFSELAHLLEGRGMVILNDENEPTFFFHRRKKVLDLCVCTVGLAERCTMKVIPQPFSDHAALLIDVQ